MGLHAGPAATVCSKHLIRFSARKTQNNHVGNRVRSLACGSRLGAGSCTPLYSLCSGQLPLPLLCKHAAPHPRYSYRPTTVLCSSSGSFDEGRPRSDSKLSSEPSSIISPQQQPGVDPHATGGTSIDAAQIFKHESSLTAQEQLAAGSMESAVGGEPTSWMRILKLTMQKLGANLWPLLFVHLLCDVLVFVLHRLSQRATNQGRVLFSQQRLLMHN